MPAPESRVGALWYSQSTNDKAPFAKGNIEVDGRKIDIVVWKNKRKQDGERTPDLHIDTDRPREPRRETPEPRPSYETRKEAPPSRPSAESEAKARRERDGVPETSLDFEDDIPF